MYVTSNEKLCSQSIITSHAIQTIFYDDALMNV